MKLVVTLIIIGMFSAPAVADQNDAALDGLFTELQTTTSRDKASKLESEIWTRWTRFGGSKQIENRMRRGVAMMNAGNLDQAVNWFSELIKDEPDFAEAWNKRATIRFLLGDHQGSKQDIIRVLELEPRHFGALAGLGMIHLQDDNLHGAVQAYEAALAVNPNMQNLRRLITQLNQKLGGQSL